MRIDERAAAKGQGFTLLIFGGVVLLCSIFFVLGMVVAGGRSAAPAPAAEVQASGAGDREAAAAEEDDLDFTFYESVQQASPPPLEAPATARPPAPPPAAPPALDPAAAASSPASPSASAPAIILQVAALSNPDQAERLRGEIAALGLPAYVLRPTNGDAFHRVQVGPFAARADADRARALLQREGYDPILRD